MKRLGIKNVELDGGHPPARALLDRVLFMPVCGTVPIWSKAFVILHWACSILLFLAPQASGADIAAAKEHQLKAAFIYNFTKFVEWPPKSFSDTGSPIIIGVAGKGLLCAEVAQVVKDRKVNGRELVVRAVESPEAAGSVHLLFVCASEDARLAEYLKIPPGANILTVGESELFAQQGGAITFLVEQERIRFDIDMVAAERAGLKVSAQLQKLARNVRTRK